DPQTPLLETLEAFDHLIKQGKVRYMGASQYSPERLAESLKICRDNKLSTYVSLQPLYNLYDRENFEKNLSPIVKEYNLGVINFYSLASGFLSGKYRTEEDLQKYIRGERVKAL